MRSRQGVCVWKLIFLGSSFMGYSIGRTEKIISRHPSQPDHSKEKY